MAPAFECVAQPASCDLRHPSMGAATAPPTPESPNSRAHGETSYDTQERIASLFSRSAASSSAAAGAGASGSAGALRAA